ncbi:MAG: hypothetical protein NTX97_11650 [Bacteroidetes bacterium]|nr:hypothetical protein [Bacteroidota bacterium]
MFSPDFIDFIKILNKHHVEYMIIGGYAVGLHGYPRYTGDLDIWIKISETNANKMLTVLNEFGVHIPNLTKEDFLRENPLSGVHFGREPLRIDILNTIDGVKFEACYPNKQTTVFEGTTIHYIHFNDLKKNKLSSGRTKDKADIEELEAKLKKKKS